MTDQAHLSQFQFIQHPDGRMGLKDLPNVMIETIEQQGQATGRDWQGELGMPTYFEEWEQLAKPRGLSRRRVSFIVLDESVTNMPGRYRHQAARVTLPATCPLELGHTGFVIGAVDQFLCLPADVQEQLSAAFITWPAGLEGALIMGSASLFDSALAGKAWQGLQRGIFSHVCANLLRPTNDPSGTGQLVQVSLVPGDYPGCPNARVLNWWEEGMAGHLDIQP